MLIMQDGALALDATPDAVMRPEVMREYFGFEAETVMASGRMWIVPKS
jgi:ABC-type cobalamin/Fe3+-siderophores transport system ATPase subunit